MAKKKARLSGESYTHQYLWMYADDLERLLEEGAGGRSLVVSAYLNRAFAIEGFANFLLERAAPETHKAEKRFFARGDYQGTKGKLLYLADQLGVPIDKGARPFQTVRELFIWRGTVVHPRVETPTGAEAIVEYEDPEEVERWRPKLLKPETSLWGNRVRADASELCDALQGAAREQRIRGVFAPRAFSGFMGSGGISLNVQ